MMKKVLLVSGLAAALAAGSLPASAHEWHHHGGDAAGAAMFGLVAGAILGSMANDAYAAPAYYPAYPTYYAPQPAYYGAPAYYYGYPHYYRHHYHHWHHGHRWHRWHDDDDDD